MIRPFDQPLMPEAGFIVLHGNLFDSAIMKTSVISPEFRERYLSNPADPNALEEHAIAFNADTYAPCRACCNYLRLRGGRR